MNDLTLTLHPIAVIHTPYKEKFSVPRQPDLVQDGIGIVELLPPYNSPEAVRGLEQFSHLWLIFQFDKVPHGKWQSTVRPCFNAPFNIKFVQTNTVNTVPTSFHLEVDSPQRPQLNTKTLGKCQTGTWRLKYGMRCSNKLRIIFMANC